MMKNTPDWALVSLLVLGGVLFAMSLFLIAVSIHEMVTRE